jgi:hypothetical protein
VNNIQVVRNVLQTLSAAGVLAVTNVPRVTQLDHSKNPPHKYTLMVRWIQLG